MTLSHASKATNAVALTLSQFKVITTKNKQRRKFNVLSNQRFNE